MDCAGSAVDAGSQTLEWTFFFEGGNHGAQAGKFLGARFYHAIRTFIMETAAVLSNRQRFSSRLGDIRFSIDIPV